MGGSGQRASSSGATKLSGWRRLASALWGEPNDPQIYGLFELRARRLVEFIDRARAHGHHVTPTHLVGRAVGSALAAVPELNVRLVGGRAVPRASVEVFFITTVARGRELTGVKVTDIDRKSAVRVAEELVRRSGEMKRGTDPDLARAKAAMQLLPRPLLRAALRFASWAAGVRGWSLPGLGLAAAPFGGAMVSSVGMFGLPVGFAPLVWMYRVPLMIVAGEIEERPVANEGRVEVEPVLPLGITADHRYVDGAHLGEALKAFRGYLEAPEQFEPPFEEAASAEG